MGDQPPLLMFMRDLGTVMTQFPALCETQVTNVVMHATTEITGPLWHRSHQRVCFGENMAPTKPIARALTRTQNTLGVYSSSDPDSPFEHMRINAGRKGKVLLFTRRNNIIRAGKHTHADAFNAVVKFFNWSQNIARPVL